jgi:glycosyltransferase involved in cell wall biosynthesis
MKKKLNKYLSVIILTFNEDIHIKRCIESVKKLTDNIFIVDSFSNDKTYQIVKRYKINFVKRKFKNHSDQLNWAIKKLNLKTVWIMRLDADEYFEPKLIHEINKKIPLLSSDINGVILKRKHIFLNKWIKFGGRYPLFLLRLWRKGFASVEKKWMDEHIVLKKGKSQIFSNNIVDHNLKGLSHFIQKHNKYADNEVIDIINIKKKNKQKINLDNKNLLKRKIKNEIYLNLPFLIGPLVYFIYRYLFKLGFLDGVRGFIYHFLQAFWYRFLVDCKLLENQIKNKNK